MSIPCSPIEGDLGGHPDLSNLTGAIETGEEREGGAMTSLEPCQDTSQETWPRKSNQSPLQLMAICATAYSETEATGRTGPAQLLLAKPVPTPKIRKVPTHSPF